MSGKAKYLSGNINGFEIINPVKSQHYMVKCPVCGKIKQMRIAAIKKYNSCGCLNIGETHFNFKHGYDKKSPIYFMWHDMKNRCYNKNADRFNCYGQRGIIVCDEWKNSFKIFHDWSLLNGWQKGLQIDRIDNDKNYTPENCRFVTRKVNSRKKQNTIWVNYMDEKMCLTDACELLGLNKTQYKTIWRALRCGKSFEFMVEKIKIKTGINKI